MAIKKRTGTLKSHTRSESGQRSVVMHYNDPEPDGEDVGHGPPLDGILADDMLSAGLHGKEIEVTYDDGVPAKQVQQVTIRL